MFCGTWQQCGHFESDGCAASTIVHETEDGERIPLTYRGDGEWGSRQAQITGNPFTYNPTTPVNRGYLSAINIRDEANLARSAYISIADGSWAGLGSSAGGQQRGRFINKQDVLYTLQDFLVDFQHGCRTIPLGIRKEYGNELAAELRIMRGWCVHQQWDKHTTTHPDNPYSYTEDDATAAIVGVTWDWVSRKSFRTASVVATITTLSAATWIASELVQPLIERVT